MNDDPRPWISEWYFEDDAVPQQEKKAYKQYIVTLKQWRKDLHAFEKDHPEGVFQAPQPMVPAHYREYAKQIIDEYKYKKNPAN